MVMHGRVSDTSQIRDTFCSWIADIDTRVFMPTSSPNQRARSSLTVQTPAEEHQGSDAAATCIGTFMTGSIGAARFIARTYRRMSQNALCRSTRGAE